MSVTYSSNHVIMSDTIMNYIVCDTTNRKCPICLCGIENKALFTWIRTTCNHVFHKRCLDEWKVSAKNSCPLCRTNLEQQCLVKNRSLFSRSLNT